MKLNTNKLIISIVVFCVATGSAFGYALYGAGKKSAQIAQLAETADTTQTGVEKGVSVSLDAEAKVGEIKSQSAASAPLNTKVTSARRGSFDDDGDEDDDEGDDERGISQSSNTKIPTTNTPVSNVPNSAPTSIPSGSLTTPTPIDTRKTSKYKNGTYTAVGSYNSLAGIERISVSVTLQNDIITNTSTISMANDRTSERYVQKFIGGYSAQIVGKNIDTVQLDHVSGSSLTPSGFNDALAKIKVSARV